MTVLNLISVYAPQAGRHMGGGKIISEIDAGEKLLICGDLNGHVGAEFDKFESVLGGFGKKNVEDEIILELAALNHAVAKTWFMKDERRSIAHESKIYKTRLWLIIDYVLIRKNKKQLIGNVRVSK